MGITKCNTVVNIMDELAPRKYAENWDNIGLLIGDGKQAVKKIMVCLDLPEWVVDEAIEKNVDMIISHHPIIFSGIKKINTDSVLGRKLLKLISNNISVYASHTNYDIVEGGLNEIFCSKLGFDEANILDTTYHEKLYKLAVYVPCEYKDMILKVISDAGSGSIGCYSHCTFSSSGMGTFKPLEGSNPFIGKVNKLESVEEYKLETIVLQKNLNKVIKAMLKVHPYEEVAYDVLLLQNKGSESGLGRMVVLDKEISLEELAIRTKKAIGVDKINVAGDTDKKVKKIALLNGAGNKYVNTAYFNGADVLITGDMQYHQILDAVELGMGIIDAGHFGSEQFMIKSVADFLRNKFNQLKLDVEIIESNENTNPVKLL